MATIPVNNLAAQARYDPQLRTYVWRRGHPWPMWHLGIIAMTTHGQMAGCCGSEMVYFSRTVPNCPEVIEVADDQLGIVGGKSTRRRPEKEWDEWVHEWLKEKHANFSKAPFHIGVLTAGQVKPWMKYLEPFGWRIVGKHINGHHNTMLYVIMLSNQLGVEIGKRENA